ncbi:MAG: anti-sigma factor [Hoeflea sp.]|nr:anti-sigma factor [Alphaproteobacteria bacterium]MBV1724665.1 anti-sigma factor [Hoeflea sp.]MBU4544246.1 anti-sigma factor [Alphaproteobacteria bacterium]MBU4550517.1 anti-sigma factor [Alphaproteobacteria bacterium]MBV1760685.1 anti-sigma factor [Hoeflea sp.]
MSPGPHIPDDDALAGEYVLGVLPLDARRAVEKRIAIDTEFASLVASWQTDLAHLDDAYQPEAPPQGVKARIDARLFAEAAKPAGGLWSSLAFWRGLAFAAIAVAAIGIFQTSLQGPADPVAAPSLVAELGAPGSSVGLVAALDPASGVFSITPAAFSPEDGKSLELWLVPGEGAPVSLGLVPGDGGQLVLTPDLTGRLSAGALLAISLEPVGGSPTGAPTGPVVLSGELGQK